MDELSTKFARVEAELGEFRAKMVEVRETSITKFKKFDAYKLELNMTIV